MEKLFVSYVFVLAMAMRHRPTAGHDAGFDYECDIYQRLEALENRQREADKLLQELQGFTVQSGSTYVRWGRTDCPENQSKLVYSGRTAGSYYEHTGGAAEHLCVPMEPEYGEYYEDKPQGGGYVYGTEYQLGDRTDRMKFFPGISPTPDLFNHDVPCAVCLSPRPTMIMVPAKRSCADDWTLEYDGLLVSGNHNTNSNSSLSASEYICLDGQPEYVNGGSSNDNGNLLFFVEGRCGSLPCPPYENGRELTCVVCTK